MQTHAASSLASSAPAERAPGVAATDSAALTPSVIPSPLPLPPTGRPSPSAFDFVSRKHSATVGAFSPNIPAHLGSPVKRKPLPPSASPAPRFASGDWGGPVAVVDDRTRSQRSFTIDTPSSRRFTPKAAPALVALPARIQEDLVPRNLDEHPHGSTPLTANSPRQSIVSAGAQSAQQPSYQIQDPFPPRAPSESNSQTDSHTRASRYDREVHPHHATQASASSNYSETAYNHIHSSREASPGMPRNKPIGPSVGRGPNLTLELDGMHDYLHDDVTEPPALTLKTPKSPGHKLTSLFNWKSNPQSANAANSPTTTFSDRSVSPGPSPMVEGRKGSPPTALDIPRANDPRNMIYYATPPSPVLLPTNPHVEELQRELQEVSAELANSIRREMELEDEVERYKALSEQVATPGLELGRRTSDYYSDSGASSVRMHFGDSDHKIEELERMRRKVEQEKAQLKVEMAARTEDSVRKGRELEAKMFEMEEQLRRGGGSPREYTGGNRMLELEYAVEQMRRKLDEERQLKQNFEDLASALQQDMENHRNERDNLRDEVVPQLRARVEGLETESADMQRLTYENARMQQEIQALRAGREYDGPLGSMGFSSIDGDRVGPLPVTSPRVARSNSLIGLSRSNSLARGQGLSLARGSLSRSNSVKEKSGDAAQPGTPLNDRMKDMEEQRDALHRALKSLLHRHDVMIRQHNKHIKLLEQERDKAAVASPRRTAFHDEVRLLRDEVNQLRRRADDALQQKWQCEKGLGGLKMDLDRAEQETSSLRNLLAERDIFVPSRPTSPIDGQTLIPPRSSSLDKAFKELRSTQALSLARIQDLESGNTDSSEAQHTLQLLMQSISDAEAERDAALKEAESYRAQARLLQASEIAHLGKEQSLASQLAEAALRMDELASQVQTQLRSNTELRQRLANTISRGEAQQKASASRVVEMQAKLRAAEEELLAAQNHSENLLSSHEDEVRQIQDAHNASLRRARAGTLSPAKFGHASGSVTPMTPLFGQRTPKIGGGGSLTEAGRTERLELRVRELERALRDAEDEMSEVVSRMNMAQVEVAELQAQRDEATRQTRRLNAEILSEREKVKKLMGKA